MITIRIDNPMDNPIARAEWAYQQRRLERHRTRRRIYLWVAYVPALLVAAVPLLMYITPATFSLWLFMLAVIAPLHIWLALRTTITAADSIQRERVAGAWDALLLSGVSARQIVAGKWWAVVRTLYGEWLLTAFLRLGVAYGVAQMLHLTPSNYYPIMNEYSRYFDSVFWYGGGFETMFLNPGMSKVCLALLFLLIISLLELGFTAALGLLAALLPGRGGFTHTALAAALRFGIIALIMAGFTLKEPVLRHYITERDCHPGSYCVQQFVTRPAQNNILRHLERKTYEERLHFLFLFGEQLYRSLTPLTDGGVRVAASLMPPPPSWWYWHLTLISSSVSGSFGVYLLLIWLVGIAARWLAVRQGALPEKRRAAAAHPK